MKRNACFSFLDLEAGHSDRNRDCDNTNLDQSQGSLAHCVDDEVPSEENLAFLASSALVLLLHAATVTAW